jgi:hypothetical protein
MIIAAVFIGIILIAGASLAGMYFSMSNNEVGLRNQAKAQQDANRVIFDKTWKTVQQIAGVADQYKDAFKDVYTQMMDARYKDNKQLLMKWVQESNPNFSPELYVKLADAIEANRSEFARVQERLIDIKREHDNLRMKFPGSLFLSSRPEIEIKLVTSSKTEKAFETGKEDDIQLFEKKK